MQNSWVLACASLNQTPMDWEGNLRRIAEAIDAAKSQKAKLLLLPELCITGYGCEDLFFADHLYTQSVRMLERLLPLSQGIAVTLGLPLQVNGKRHNTVALIAEGQILGITAKQHLANEGIHYEPRWFSPWEAGRVLSYQLLGQSFPLGQGIYEWQGRKIGIEICEDSWRETDRPAELYRQSGAGLILNASASHFALGKAKTREEIVLKSSLNYDCTFAYVNLMGNEAGRAIYDGDRLAASKGFWQLSAEQRLELGDWKISYCDLGNPGHEAQAPVHYPPNEEFSRALTLGLYDYLRKSGAKGYTLSLSGGADSAACAVLVHLMAQRVKKELPDRPLLEPSLVCAYQATANSSQLTKEAAHNLASSLQVPFHLWDIEPMVNAYTHLVEESTGKPLTWDHDDLTLQNIQSRSRSPGIWMLANVHEHLLLSTANRSEADAGYATMDGDTSGSLSPLGGIDKHFIRQWLLYAMKELGYQGLEKVCALEPSAELRPLKVGQTDEKDLMPYVLLAAIEREAIAFWKSPLETYHSLRPFPGVDEVTLAKHIARFFSLWSRSQWKRERLAPSFHLDDFSVDPKTWCRFPILSKGFDLEIEELRKAVLF